MTDRREFLSAFAALFCAPALALASLGSATSKDGTIRLAASWQTGHGYQVGVLGLADENSELSEHRDSLRMQSAIDVPTRAHALLQEPGGTVLAVARRPGDWLLRWDPNGKPNGKLNGKPLAWCWIEPRRAFTGHVISDGQTLYVAEMDLDTGAGLIGVRDAKTLEKIAEWPTHGVDPHQLVWDEKHTGAHTCARTRAPFGALIVANGGVATRPETGRQKRDLDTMDSSLVRLDAKTGELLGQWRLSDPRLSLRHLAWNGDQLGIALQAEHDNPNAKAAAPVLAVFDGTALTAIAAPSLSAPSSLAVSSPAPPSLAGYGGDIAPVQTPAGQGFAVSCPRANGIAMFTTNGQWQGLLPLPEACALAASIRPSHSSVSVGGATQVMLLPQSQPARHASISGFRLDNHWIALR